MAKMRNRYKEIQTEEQSQHQKPDGILTKKINRKTFVTEIYFDKNSKETFKIKCYKKLYIQKG